MPQQYNKEAFFVCFEHVDMHMSTQIPLMQLRFFKYLLLAKGNKVTILLLRSDILLAASLINMWDFFMDLSVLFPGESLGRWLFHKSHLKVDLFAAYIIKMNSSFAWKTKKYAKDCLIFSFYKMFHSCET